MYVKYGAENIPHKKLRVHKEKYAKTERDRRETDGDTEKRDKRETDRPKETQAYRRAKTETSKTE